MPKKRTQKRKAKEVPRWGRSKKDLDKELGLHKFSGDVPLGNTDPTMVQGTLYGGMPNSSRMARGRLVTYRGKRN